MNNKSKRWLYEEIREYLLFMRLGQHDYNVREWMEEYGAGESLGQLFGNLISDLKILKECGFNVKESVIYQDYLTAPYWLSAEM